MRQDLRYALRWTRRHAGLAAAIVLTLGLGIGGATAVFSVARTMLLSPLPYPDADRLVRIHELTRQGDRFSASDPGYLDFAREPGGLAAVGAWRDLGTTAVLTGSGDPRRVLAVPVSASFFDVLAVPPSVGRAFTTDDERNAAVLPLVLGNTLWRERFGADPGVVGRTVTLDGATHVVAGVMPPGFDFPGGAEAWVPLRASPSAPRGRKELALIGRLAPGVSLADVRGHLQATAARIAEGSPDTNGGWSADVEPLRNAVVPRPVRDASWMLLAAVGVLLLLACANIANLLLAQASGRRPELQVRAALGATHERIVRQLVTEAGVLALAGTALGVLIAVWSVDALQTLGAARIPRFASVRVDALVLAFSAAAGAACCLLFGLAPALHTSRVDLRTAMDAGNRYTSGRGGPRHALVVIEVALALTLVVAAGLMGRTLTRLLHADVGFEADGLVAVPMELPRARQQDGDEGAGFYRSALEALGAIPGVERIAASSTNPFAQFGFSNSVTPEDRAADAPSSGLVQAGWRAVTPGFFETMGIPIREGRGFTSDDDGGHERVVAISNSLARRLWPGESAVGKKIYWGGTRGRTRTVVGVVGDIRDVRTDSEPGSIVFVPHAQVPVPAMTALLRTSLAPASLAPAVRARLRELAPDQPAPSVDRVVANRAASVAGPLFDLWLLVGFAGLALVLAATGVYAMLSFWVSERRRELALRVVLGADPVTTARLVVRRGLLLVGAGVAAGSLLSLLLGRAMSSLLFGVRAADPLTFTAAAAALALVGLVACWLPARRAARIEPMTVLRGQ